MAIAEFEQPLLQVTRIDSVGKSREINIATAPYGVASIILPLIVVATPEFIVYPAAWPVSRSFLSRTRDNFTWGNFPGFKAGNKNQWFYD